jgi:TPR repeat protein
MYERGRGVAQDYAEAVRWYRKAAEQGHANAQFNLGNMYSNLQFNLGNMYFDGRGVPQDYAEAVRWYQKAADQGVPEAQFNLGLMYERGRGVPRDSVEAYMRMSLAVSLATGDVQKKFAEERALVAKKMTAKQIVEAQLRARGWKPKTAQESTESTQK